MDKLDNILEYYASIKAYYLFQVGIFFNKPEYREFILNKNYLNGTRVAFISNLMLASKEKIVNNKGNMEYGSKIYIDALENSVSTIATKVENGYKLSNYVFPDAATLVAIIRNKLAHGKYVIDFKHNRVIFNHKGVDIIVNIDKLTIFILQAYSSTFKKSMTTKYERNIMYNATGDFGRTYGIKNIAEVRKIIKNFNYVSFTIESTNGIPVMDDCRQYLEGFIKYFYKNYATAMKSDFYREMVKYLKDRNCTLKIEYKNLRDKAEIDEIIKYAENDLLDNPNLSYRDQAKIIGLEIQKRINGNYKNFDAVLANISNLILVESIADSNSVDSKKLTALIGKVCSDGLKVSYEEFGLTLIAMFNALYIYPFDDVYDTSGEYKPIRNDAFDFSVLDLSKFNPSIITINDTPLIDAKSKLDNIVKKQVILTKKILQQESNLNKVNGNIKAQTSIKNSINDLRNSLSQLIIDYITANKEFEKIKKDYTDNYNYFRNKAIIEGIRNSIAHGHYEFIAKGNIWDTEVIFNDIYEGKNTFQIKMTFLEFATLIEDNYNNVSGYINNKSNGLKKTLN